MNTINDEWEHFRNKTISQQAGASQLEDMKNAFFAGALIMFDEIREAFDENDADSTISKMTKLSDEVNTHFLNVLSEVEKCH